MNTAIISKLSQDNLIDSLNHTLFYLKVSNKEFLRKDLSKGGKIGEFFQTQINVIEKEEVIQVPIIGGDNKKVPGKEEKIFAFSGF